MAAEKLVTVLGSGSWGTALAQHLDRLGHRVTIWGRSPEILQGISEEHRNLRYFPDLMLSHKLLVQADLGLAVKGAELVVLTVPSGVVHQTIKAIKPFLHRQTIVLSAAKGLESQTLKPMSEVISAELGADAKVCALSGPSFAREVLLGLPTVVTVASKNLAIAGEAAAFFHSDSFRVYTSDDLVGVEFGGVLKNVIALASGVVEGMGMGANARAALLTRGLLEMQRLTVAVGGQASTITGLSGLGDLLLTATGDLSRNRQVGLRLGKGEQLSEIMDSLGQVAEGVQVAPKVAELCRRLHVRAPIIEEVDRILSGQGSVKESVKRLLSRAPGEEGLQKTGGK